MERLKTYANTGGLGTAQEISVSDLNALQDALAPVEALKGFRVGGDFYNDGLGGDLVIAGNRILLGSTGVDVAVTLGDSLEGTLNTGSTWFYLYASGVGPVQSFMLSTTVPNAALEYRSDSSAYRYMGCYRVDATGFLACNKVGGEYRYRRSAIAAARYTAISAGDTAWSDVSLAGWVPPHARIVHLTLEITAENAFGFPSVGIPRVRVRTKGDTTSITAQVLAAMRDLVLVKATNTVTMECDSLQRIQVEIGGGNVTPSTVGKIYVDGFDERTA